MKFDTLNYLCQGGEVLKQATAYRETYLRLYAALWKVANALGADKMNICDEMMKLRGVVFPGSPPEGWTKPDRKLGISRPKKRVENAEILKHFTPGGCYSVKKHEALMPFFTWLKCPTHYQWHDNNGRSGSCSIGDPFYPVFLSWYVQDGPMMLTLPDVAAEKAYAVKDGRIIKDNVLDWKVPDGLVQILPEQWKLMEAQHRQKEHAA